MVYILCYTFRHYAHISYLNHSHKKQKETVSYNYVLAEVIRVRNNICQIESGMRKNVFLYNKIGLTPVWVVWKQIERIRAIHSI